MKVDKRNLKLNTQETPQSMSLSTLQEKMPNRRTRSLTKMAARNNSKPSSDQNLFNSDSE